MQGYPEQGETECSSGGEAAQPTGLRSGPMLAVSRGKSRFSILSHASSGVQRDVEGVETSFHRWNSAVLKGEGSGARLPRYKRRHCFYKRCDCGQVAGWSLSFPIYQVGITHLLFQVDGMRLRPVVPCLTPGKQPENVSYRE